MSKSALSFNTAKQILDAFERAGPEFCLYLFECLRKRYPEEFQQPSTPTAQVPTELAMQMLSLMDAAKSLGFAKVEISRSPSGTPALRFYNDA